ncbi:bifunctional lysine-specific demethylase and histidyl-hydroxylase NO66-like [Ornithodoros turicata]|uniref:bifunctional lysine-specific demethylase and histidyl-hydroxylase NO66-like n=1 Tax=Ornithodoros turicata TaxID=34597 RepID=UPI00313A3467
MKPGKKSAFSVFKKKKKAAEALTQVATERTPSGKVNKASRSKRLSLPKQFKETLINGDVTNVTTKSLTEKRTTRNGPKKKAKRNSECTNSFTEVDFSRSPSRLNVHQASDDEEHETDDGLKHSERRFAWLIDPIKKEQFFNELWEKKPMLLKRHNAKYYKNLFSCSYFDKVLREKVLYFTENVDVTTYENDKRETHNPEGRAHAAAVWDAFQRGCSIRLLNPQTYSRGVWRLCSQLQEFFGSFVGANVYLTPAGSQGFAPHYDDIEAFVLQLEGKKEWKLYAPRTPSEELPRYSSSNLSAGEVGEPILTAVLEPGDLLYFPRGIIHQAKTTDAIHSLHITVSTCQKNTWGDLFEKMLPRALQLAIEDDVEFRRSLPRDYLHSVGVANSDLDENPSRDAFLRKVRCLMEKVITYCPIDAAADQMAKGYVHDSLPPVLSDDDKRCSIHEGELWEDGRVVNAQELDPDAEVRLLRKTAVRLVMEEDSVRVYHSFDNSRVYHEREPIWFEAGAESAPAIEALFHAYPQYLRIDDLPLQEQLQRIEVASMLYEKGILRTRTPLESYEDSD